MSKPADISQEAWDAAGQVMVLSMRMARHMAEPMDPMAFIARAIMAATLAERERWAAAATYFDRYCQDEAEDVENCVCGRQQHEDAQAFAAIRKRGEA